MSDDEALNWIQQVDGRLFHTPSKDSDREDAREVWVAVVRVPRTAAKQQWIIGLGDSMEEAAFAAEKQWQEIWGDDLGVVH